MRRLTAAGLLPERAGQPVRAWAHISLADLVRLDGDSAPVVTGDVNVDALEDLVRLCVELDRLRRDGERRADTAQARAAIEQAVIGKTMILLLHFSISV